MITLQFNKFIGKYLPFNIDDLVLAWLQVNNIWPDQKYFKVTYNSFYHFYRIECFPSALQRRDTHKTLEKAILDLCKSQSINAKCNIPTWRWEDKKKIDGCLIDINIKDQ